MGDSREEIESFEYIAAARHLENTMENVEKVADNDDGAFRKFDESTSHFDQTLSFFKQQSKG